MSMLNKKQLETVMNLFTTGFVNSTDETMRRSLFIQYSDDFGHEMNNWQELCREKIKSYTSNPVVLEHYDMLVGHIDKHIDEADIFIRKFEADDIDEVREILNDAFRMLMLIPDSEDDKKFNRFLKSDYSVVAVYDGNIVGVALADVVSEISWNVLYLDSFAIKNGMRNQGIGKKMIVQIEKQASKEKIHKLVLKTDKKIEAYDIYRHWGFEESESLFMQHYF